MLKILVRTKRLLLLEQKSIFSSAAVIALMIVVARAFGFLRYRILVGLFTKEQLDLFFASFRVPDLIFEILISGALTSAFIPIFIKYQKNKQELHENISSIVNLISLVMFAFVITAFFLAPYIIPLITPGFSPQQTHTVVFYSKLLLVGQLPFLVFASFLTGVGQAHKVFIISALSPLVYNLAIIIVTVFFSSNFFLLAPVIGVILGALLSFLIQLPLLPRAKFVYMPIIKITRGLKEFVSMIVPRVVTTAAAQIDATIDLSLTTLMGAGSYTIFYLAQHLQLLPVSIIGISFGQASLPYMSQLYQDNKMEEFRRTIISSLLSMLFFTIPLMSFFVFARTPLVRLFFGGPKFDWAATVQTAVTLSYFSLSIPFHTIYYFITRCFYAILDSRTPFVVSVATIFLNIALSLYFVFVLRLPVEALAISFSLTIIINVCVLFALLASKVKGLDLRFFTIEIVKITVTTFIASLFVYYLMKLLDGLVFDTTRTINVFMLLLTGGGVYLALYLFLSWLLQVKEFAQVATIVQKAQMYRKRIIEIYTDIDR